MAIQQPARVAGGLIDAELHRFPRQLFTRAQEGWERQGAQLEETGPVAARRRRSRHINRGNSGQLARATNKMMPGACASRPPAWPIVAQPMARWQHVCRRRQCARNLPRVVEPPLAAPFTRSSCQSGDHAPATRVTHDRFARGAQRSWRIHGGFHDQMPGTEIKPVDAGLPRPLQERPRRHPGAPAPSTPRPAATVPASTSRRVGTTDPQPDFCRSTHMNPC